MASVSNNFNQSPHANYRVVEDEQGFHIYIRSEDPCYEIQITLQKREICLSDASAGAIRQLVGAVNRAVGARFRQASGDPTRWGATYDPEKKQAFVSCTGGDRAGENTAAVASKIRLQLQDSKELTECRQKPINFVYDALAEVYAEVMGTGMSAATPSAPAVSDVAEEDKSSASDLDEENEPLPTPHPAAASAPTLPKGAMSLALTPTGPSAPPSAEQPSPVFLYSTPAHPGVARLFGIFNEESHKLQPKYRNTFLRDVRWEDLLHSKWGGKNLTHHVGVAQARAALNALVRKHQLEQESQRVMRQWLQEITDATRLRWQHPECVAQWLMISLLNDQIKDLIN